MSRRRALAGGAAALGAAVLGSTRSAEAVATAPLGVGKGVSEETRTLDELYREASAHGGKLVVYAGGDRATSMDAIGAAFLAAFPDIELTMVVDYSKFHDVRIDHQLATGTLVPDVALLQTVQNFPRWAEEGRLLRYKPAGFSKIHNAFKDPGGAWMAPVVIAFSYMYDATTAGPAAPRSPADLVDPRWRGKIASSYPHDDDAVLYLYKRYVETYGWSWLDKLVAQDMQFARGSFTPAAAVGARRKVIGIGGSGSLVAPATTTPTWAVADGHPFMAWGQRMAIFNDAANLAAAKLYVNWMLSVERQQAAFNGWSVRTDVTPPGGLKPVWQYPDSNLDGFPRFMADRAEAERWRQTFALYFGEVQGEPTPGRLGLHPGR
ncbi:ABC transporter substrate-binding protein [Lentzea sp. BCCO 10_0798]|uniref:ABC transporter substrate-binding protein n=1 Tax=Lentzea kristufekii TaxID=3095430 RepID=A0ABU4TJX9_9PSEU|nr:ABC transporter substrate-binding protein [Lentzea sp. BCCO 10_0798]MDX8048548.1 ABC transporter substrate-binding protein [Lentzea sp. BCCO 10_0798]